MKTLESLLSLLRAQHQLLVEKIIAIRNEQIRLNSELAAKLVAEKEVRVNLAPSHGRSRACRNSQLAAEVCRGRGRLESALRFRAHSPATLLSWHASFSRAPALSCATAGPAKGLVPVDLRAGHRDLLTDFLPSILFSFLRSFRIFSLRFSAL